MRNLVHVVDGELDEAVCRDFERCFRFDHAMEDVFVGVEMFRRIYMTGGSGLLAMGDQMSHQFDAEMRELGDRQT